MADALRRWLELQRDLGGDELILDAPADLRAMITPPKKVAKAASVVREARAAAIVPEVSAAAAPARVILAASDDPRLALPSHEAIAESVAGCTRCALCKGRTLTVPGEGNQAARLMVVGEGPGEKEDLTGRPFVGRAGELLDKMLLAIDLPRESVYIANVVKCRPPKNRAPLPDERASCLPYLRRQIELIQPRVILALGSTAAEALLGVKKSLGEIRLKVHHWDSTPLVITYHPAALLRNPNWKRPAWDDLRFARQLLDAST